MPESYNFFYCFTHPDRKIYLTKSKLYILKCKIYLTLSIRSWTVMDRIEYGKLTHSDHSTEWRDNQTLVVLTSGACLLALVIALKNILNIPTEQLTRDLILYVCILGGLATSYPLVTRRRADMAIGHPGLWIAMIVSVTMAIIVMYAL